MANRHYKTAPCEPRTRPDRRNRKPGYPDALTQARRLRASALRRMIHTGLERLPGAPTARPATVLRAKDGDRDV